VPELPGLIEALKGITQDEYAGVGCGEMEDY
jgi:hypothetical protein